MSWTMPCMCNFNGQRCDGAATVVIGRELKVCEPHAHAYQDASGEEGFDHDEWCKENVCEKHMPKRLRPKPVKRCPYEAPPEESYRAHRCW